MKRSFIFKVVAANPHRAAWLGGVPFLSSNLVTENTPAGEIERAIAQGLVLGYKVCEWTAPEVVGCPLFAFDTFEQAASWACRGHYIFLAEAKNVRPGRVVYGFPRCDAQMQVNCSEAAEGVRKWDDGGPYPSDIPCTLCDEIKLITNCGVIV